MMVRCLLAALAVVTLSASATPSGARGPGRRAVVEAEPDPRRPRPLDRWPGAADLARLRFVEGKTTVVVLLVLGHPSRVERRPDGEEVWEYSWHAACRVWVRRGVCTGTFYTAGY